MGMDPEELINEYREALKNRTKDDILAKSDFYYYKGWYYVNIAIRFPDGSIGAISPASGMRRKDMEQEIKKLKEAGEK